MRRLIDGGTVRNLTIVAGIAIDTSRIARTRVLATYLGGTAVYNSSS